MVNEKEIETLAKRLYDWSGHQPGYWASETEHIKNTYRREARHILEAIEKAEQCNPYHKVLPHIKEDFSHKHIKPENLAYQKACDRVKEELLKAGK